MSEQQRHQLYEWMEEAMGPDRAGTMMELLPSDGSGVATKHDLLELEARLALRFESLEHQFRGELHESITNATGRMITWMVAMNAALVSAIGIATGIVVAVA